MGTGDSACSLPPAQQVEEHEHDLLASTALKDKEDVHRLQ
jgi:hypothetical protein